MTQDRPLLGIALMTGFCVLAPIGDALAKLLVVGIPLLQLLLARFVIQAVILLPIVAGTRQSFRMSKRIFWLMALRTGLHILGIAMMFGSLRFLPLADAVAIAFVMPFIMLLLGKYVLGEQVGRFRLMACVVGFGGTLLVIQPSFADVGAPALLPLGVAVVFALFMLVTRQVAKDIGAIHLQAVSGVLASIALGVLAYFTFDGSVYDLTLVWPNTKTTLLLLLIGAVGTCAHLLMTWSLRYAPSATLAPMQYIEIPVATFVGWLLFSDLPNGLAAIGITITVIAGLTVIFREQMLAKRDKTSITA
ncbi:MAG: DMT family transporter [Paracoccaceae bacterium]|nr:DMT family transporter [Paracoccaceae bacterium]